MGVCKHVWRGTQCMHEEQRTISGINSGLFHFVWDNNVSVGFLLHEPGWLACEPPGFFLSPLQFLHKHHEYRHFCSHIKLYMSSRDLNTGPQAYVAHKATEPPPQPNNEALALWSHWWCRPLILALQRQVALSSLVYLTGCKPDKKQSKTQSQQYHL